MKLSKATIEIIGLGLIGASLGKAIVRKRLAAKVIGCTRSAKTARLALQQAAAHEVILGEEEMFALNPDILILATPVGVTAELIKKIPENLGKTLVMDVGSTKGEIFAAESRRRTPLNFLSAHPMAGTEKNGIQGSNPDLFNGRPFLLIRGRKLKPESAGLGRELVEGIGAIPYYLKNPKEHDLAVAFLSHLPYFLAYSLMHVATFHKVNIGIAGPSFRDATRVASSNPDTTFDFLWGNRENLREVLKKFKTQFQKAEKLLHLPEGNEFKKWMKEAERRRKRLI